MLKSVSAYVSIQILFPHFPHLCPLDIFSLYTYPFKHVPHHAITKTFLSSCL